MPEKILLVDDEEHIREPLKELLRVEGYEVATARNGREALEKARKESPDLILLDIMMPVMGGFEAIERLKADEDTASVPVIFLSSATDAADKVKGLNLGAEDFITKPYDNAEVLARVSNQLRLKRLTNKLMKANRELARANEELIKRQRELEEDLLAAAGIQRSLLPLKDPELEAVEVAWRFEPCESVGGDIFNLHLLNDQHLVIYVLDVSGHGVPSAMVTVAVSQVLSPHSGYIVEGPAGLAAPSRVVSATEVLTRLAMEYPLDRFGKFFTICYLVLNVSDGTITYSNAGHPMPVIIRADGTTELLKEGSTIVSLYESVPFSFVEASAKLNPNDRLFLYTDGITEHPDEKGRCFGFERLLGELQDLSGRPLGETLDGVMEKLARFGRGKKPLDDVTLLGLEFRGGRAA